MLISVREITKIMYISHQLFTLGPFCVLAVFNSHLQCVDVVNENINVLKACLRNVHELQNRILINGTFVTYEKDLII